MEDFKKAISYSEAAEVLGTLVVREARSVQQGQRVPDFILSWLSRHNESQGEGLTLSYHFSDRLVALIFDSYT